MRGTGNNDLVFPDTAYVVDTAKTVLVPAELYEKGMEEDYLRFNGMAPERGEVAVASAPDASGAQGVPQNDIVAVMAVPADEWGLLREKYERGEVGVTSPLLRICTQRGIELEREQGRKWGRKRDVNLFLTAENVYLAVWENKELRMAEVLPEGSVDSLLYYMQVVGRNFKLRKFCINVGGECVGEAAEALKRYFGKVRIVEVK